MKTFLISRTDAIGDVVLTLPVAGWLKQAFPECRVILLGRTYTQAVADACPWVDAFLNFDELLALPMSGQIQQLRQVQADVVLHVFPNKVIAQLARLASIPVRIGTRNRWFHWLTCTKLVALSRRNSTLHEAQLNLHLLLPLGYLPDSPLSRVGEWVRLRPQVALPEALQESLQARRPNQLNIILHPRSRGSAREWGLPHFGELARLLHAAGHRVWVTGTAAEGAELTEWLQQHRRYLAADLTGQLSLPQFIAFIAAADGLVAGSTGPLHLAAALGRHALGLYPPIRPMHPGRWAPLGARAEYLVLDRPNCADCRHQPAACTCIKALLPLQVMGRVVEWQPHPTTTSTL
ncbi:glycosyltransferase family 9 protein [Hymenobacter aerilatus]|uniref:Glycosyltransferase family 9 protein n=1 Tax=Hymenobacter aerilatus TaxID=2932251 RepID=A0A8T9ST64_9BACT|nr:glycosyltransferase family 9 protein [Hymenobacter aerilatus]UOR05332.1 glycosyltransferase family 9 protein [Hymenobacter aerilatus]